MRIVLALSTLVFATGSAWAHTGHPGGHNEASFAYGFMHPLGGLDHLLAMVAVGLLAWLVSERAASKRALWFVPAAFVGMMAMGGLAGVQGIGLPLVELGIGLSIVAIGAAVAFGARLPVAGAMALVGFFALFHGYAHGTEMPVDSSGLAYGLGFMIATALLHGAGIAAGFSLARLSGSEGLLAARLGGGAMALAGVAVVGGIL